MSTLHVPSVGAVDFSNVDDGYWSFMAPFGGSEIDVTFDTGGPDMSSEMLAKVTPLIADMAKCDERARAAILSNFNASNDSSTRLYLSHHLEELESDDRIQCFGTDSKNLGITDLLASLRLKRAGFYPAGDTKIATFDYSIGPDFTDYILAVEFSADGSILDVSMES